MLSSAPLFRRCPHGIYIYIYMCIYIYIERERAWHIDSRYLQGDPNQSRRNCKLKQFAKLYFPISIPFSTISRQITWQFSAQLIIAIPSPENTWRGHGDVVWMTLGQRSFSALLACSGSQSDPGHVPVESEARLSALTQSGHLRSGSCRARLCCSSVLMLT